MKLTTRLKLISMAFSRKYDHISWFTFQLNGKRDDGRFEIFVQSYYEGTILNAPEIIKEQVQVVIDAREK